MTKIEAILFDKDGTLFDFGETWGVWAQILLDDLSRGDPALKSRLANAMGFDLTAKAFFPNSPVIAGTPGYIADCLIPHLPGASPSSVISHMNITAAQAPQVEAVSLVPALGALRQRGLRLGVATNDAEHPARAHLASVGIGEYFDFVSGYDSGFGSKPLPGPCFAFSEAMNIRPGKIAMVGDSRNDLLAGRGTGMATIAVLTGMAGRDVLAPLADVVLNDIGEIGGWLDHMARKEPTAA